MATKRKHSKVAAARKGEHLASMVAEGAIPRVSSQVTSGTRLVAPDGQDCPLDIAGPNSHLIFQAADTSGGSSKAASPVECSMTPSEHPAAPLSGIGLPPPKTPLPLERLGKSAVPTSRERELVPCDGPWIVSHMMACPGQLLGISPGCPIEVATHNETGTRNGTALFTLQQLISMDPQGVALEADYLGASDPLTRAKFAELWKDGCHSKGALHLCNFKASSCCFSIPGRSLIHFDTARRKHCGPKSASWMMTPIIAPTALSSRREHNDPPPKKSTGLTMTADKVGQLRDKLEGAKRRFRQSQGLHPPPPRESSLYGLMGQSDDKAVATSVQKEDFREGSGPAGDAQLMEMAAVSPSQPCAQGSSLGSKDFGAGVADGSDPSHLQVMLQVAHQIGHLALTREGRQVPHSNSEVIGPCLESLLLRLSTDTELMASLTSKPQFRLPDSLLPPNWAEMSKNARSRWARTVRTLARKILSPSSTVQEG